MLPLGAWGLQGVCLYNVALALEGCSLVLALYSKICGGLFGSGIAQWDKAIA